MELVIKCTALAVFSTLVILLVRRMNPELSFALSTAAAVVLLLACGTIMEELLRALRDMQTMLGTSAAELSPMLKCLGIAVASKTGSDLCRDASQTALAAAVETAGNLCAAAVAMPLILSLMTTIGGML